MADALRQARAPMAPCASPRAPPPCAQDTPPPEAPPSIDALLEMLGRRERTHCVSPPRTVHRGERMTAARTGMRQLHGLDVRKLRSRLSHEPWGKCVLLRVALAAVDCASGPPTDVERLEPFLQPCLEERTLAAAPAGGSHTCQDTAREPRRAVCPARSDDADGDCVLITQGEVAVAQPYIWGRLPLCPIRPLKDEGRLSPGVRALRPTASRRAH